MAAKIVTVAQQKGSAGKSTLAAQLAVAWGVGGRDVALMDIDPQGSLAGWFSLRAGQSRTQAVLNMSDVSGWRVGTELNRLNNDHDLIVIDCPPHAETETKNAVRLADLALIPVQPSPMDVWATRATLAIAAAEGTPALIVLNRVPPRGRVLDQVRALLNDEGAALASTTLGNRVAFAASMLDGLGVIEDQPNSQAAAEVLDLAAELMRSMKP